MANLNFYLISFQIQ